MSGAGCARRGLEAVELAGALAYEAVLGNVDALHPEIVRARPYPGDERSRRRIEQLLAGGALARGDARPRNLQDALCFKGLTQTHGSCWDAFDHLHAQLTIELRSSGDSAFVLATRTVRSPPAATRSPLSGWRSITPGLRSRVR